MRETTPSYDLIRGIWKENPVLIQMLGLCPALAVTNTVKNALAMSAATFFVLTCSSVLIASVKRLIPNEVRISSYILVIATFVTLADMLLQAYAPVQHKELGAFIALIVVNCMILGRQEAFSSRNTVYRSLLDAIGVGIGFTKHRQGGHAANQQSRLAVLGGVQHFTRTVEANHRVFHPIDGTIDADGDFKVKVAQLVRACARAMRG